jgi:hypothetical protein
VKEVQILISDDLTYAETGKKVEADETLILAIGGVKRELDLTSQHADELRKLLEPYLRAGHMPGTEPQAPSRQGTTAGKSLMVGRERMAKLRDWVDETHLRGLSGPDRPAYMTTTGKHYAPDWLLKAYATAMAERGEYDEWIDKWSQA